MRIICVLFLFISLHSAAQKFTATPVFNGKPINVYSFIVNGRETKVFQFKEGGWVQDATGTAWYSRRELRKWYHRFIKQIKI